MYALLALDCMCSMSSDTRAACLIVPRSRSVPTSIDFKRREKTHLSMPS